jgi:hypothetical protein
MKQTAEAAAAPASLGAAQDAAAPGVGGPPDADGQQALQQYLVNLCQPAALVSSKRQRRIDNNVGQSSRRLLWCGLLSLAPCQAQCAPGAGLLSVPVACCVQPPDIAALVAAYTGGGSPSPGVASLAVPPLQDDEDKVAVSRCACQHGQCGHLRQDVGSTLTHNQEVHSLCLAGVCQCTAV